MVPANKETGKCHFCISAEQNCALTLYTSTTSLRKRKTSRVNSFPATFCGKGSGKPWKNDVHGMARSKSCMPFRTQLLPLPISVYLNWSGSLFPCSSLMHTVAKIRGQSSGGLASSIYLDQYHNLKQTVVAFIIHVW